MLPKNIIYCLDKNYKYFEDYIKSICSKINCSLYKYSEIPFLDIDPKLNYIFVQRLPEFILNSNKSYDNIYLINTEQLCRKYDDWLEKINSIPSFIKIIDFSKENIKYYINRNCYYIPYQVNYNEIYNFQKDKDICMISDENMPNHRKYIVNQLIDRGYNITICSGWNSYRDMQIFRHKILINIGYSPCAKIMEQMRCNRCIMNKMIVISDMKLDSDYILSKYVVYEDYDKMVEKIIEVYENYEKYYSILFSNFDDNIQKIDEIQKDYLSILA
jgi:hypothetical protein